MITPPSSSSPPAKPSATARSSTATKTALIVDDFPSVRFYHTHILQQSGFTCRVATNGREALASLHKQLVDLVVLDIVMPEMNGEELIQNLRASNTLAQIPVLVISTEPIGNRIRRERTSTAGPVGFARKPLLPAAILAEVADLLR